MTYQYICYHGKDELIVNEHEKPKRNRYTFRDGYLHNLMEWQKTCKPIHIYDRHEKYLLAYCIGELSQEGSGGLINVKGRFKSGILINPDVVEFKMIKSRMVHAMTKRGNNAFYTQKEYAFFVDKKEAKETQDDLWTIVYNQSVLSEDKEDFIKYCENLFKNITRK